MVLYKGKYLKTVHCPIADNQFSKPPVQCAAETLSSAIAQLLVHKRRRGNVDGTVVNLLVSINCEEQRTASGRFLFIAGDGAPLVRGIEKVLCSPF